jgi:uncharacterized protein DUF6328
MELPQKVKTALDETRMLILGAEILLGFELRGAFADGFDRLPLSARRLDAIGLGLMVLAAALLIAPEPYHRIVEGGADSGRFHQLVTAFADLALLPFALALGIDLFLASQRVFGTAPALAAGIAGAALALALWYGLPRARQTTTGQRERAMTERQRDERPETPLHAKIEQLLTEARVVLPGVQALFGFQLSIVLTTSFERLPAGSRIGHAASIGLLALSVILLMAPAAYHRIVYAGEDSEAMLHIGSGMITAATLPLALGLALDIYVVIGRIIGEAVGLASGLCGLALLLGLWYAYPLATLLRDRRKRRRGAAEGHDQSG